MNKLFTKIVGACLGLTMAVGVGVAVAGGSKEATKVDAADSTLTISGSDFNTTSYAANNGAHTTGSIGWYSNQVMKNGSNMQWQKNNGYIYNTTDLGTIKSVTVNSSAGSFTTYYGTSAHPTSGTTVGGGFFTVKVGSATGTTSSIVVTYTVASTTEATGISFSPSSVTVSGGESGSFTPTLTGGSGNYEKTISWTSSNTSIIPTPANSEDGVAVNFTTTNPASNTTVTLTGTVVSPGSATASISITVNHVAEYTITYDANGGTGTMSDSINKVSANGFTAPTGMEFKEWNTAADGKGTTYAVGATVTADTDLYAIWQRLRYTTGFESSDEFTASTTYNNSTPANHGKSGKQWSVLCGSPTETQPRTGSQDMHLRYYSSVGESPYMEMTWDVVEGHEMTFYAKGHDAARTISVEYSTDSGTNWSTLIAGESCPSSDYNLVTATIPTYTAKARFRITLTSEVDKKGVFIDDLEITTMAEPSDPAVTITSKDGTGKMSGVIGDIQEVTYTTAHDTGLTLKWTLTDTANVIDWENPYVEFLKVGTDATLTAELLDGNDDVIASDSVTLHTLVPSLDIKVNGTSRANYSLYAGDTITITVTSSNQPYIQI